MTGRGRRIAVWMVASLLAAPPTWSRPQSDPELSCYVPVLRNGDFALGQSEGGRIPWWLGLSETGQVVEGPEGFELVLTGERQSVVQTVPAYAPGIRGVILRGRVRGSGTLSLYGGGTAAHEFSTAPDVYQDFEVVLEDATAMHGNLRPPLRIQLSGETQYGEPLRSGWTNIEVLAPLPCPTESALRAEVLAHLERYFAAVLGACLDDLGPRSTPFVTFDFSATSGERAGSPRPRVGDVGFYEILHDAWLAEPRDDWEAALVAFIDAYIELCLHPETGLEARFDPALDVRGDEAVQLHRGLAFLIDVARSGPRSREAVSLAAAERMARTILATGVLPDGEVAASYRPSDGTPSFDVPHLRRLDVPAQLARLAAITEDADLAEAALEAAREACLTLAFDHYWPGDWQNIDPGFDDNFGHYGARAVTMWEAHPNERVFATLALSGYGRYAPLWRRAVRLGGNIAADQVRCWRLVATISKLKPTLAEEVGGLLGEAAHAHFQGEQLAGGIWIDTTVKNFGHVQLPVGDTGGVPQNLLEGLGLLYGLEDMGLRTEQLRAMFTAVLRATQTEFGRERGFAAQRGADPSATGFAGSTRVAIGLVEMLGALGS